ncbi:hypothetical protein ABT076_22390 [Streptomyces sp. NPDC002131]|uniref:hypothetical protein n=1 Tax=Streptomyces sp. NPDC002131 TaxID=3154535 RepID=UPI003325DE54
MPRINRPASALRAGRVRGVAAALVSAAAVGVLRVVERTVSWLSSRRRLHPPHLGQETVAATAGPQVLIRAVKGLRQAEPVPAQSPEVEDSAPVGCEVHIAQGAER